MANGKDFRNRYPIILVHGFMGWGRDEALGFKYWGGNVDIEARLNDMHFHTRTATVGPISSSWERAVELYHYIVGGRVDYGAAHARKYGVKRFGHTFPGIYPLVSETNKIHLVGHSMGGLTVCEFESMLRNGSEEEREYFASHPDEGISDLFLGGKHWVHSVTGIAPGFNGSTAFDNTDGQGHMVTLIKQAILFLASLDGADPAEFVYDFKLDQWGLKREKGEHLVEYLERVFESELWKSRNISFADLTSAGAAKIGRERLRMFPETYYFSFSGKATFINPITKFALPNATMNPMFIPGALSMGRNQENAEFPGEAIEWRDNDGCIPCAATRHVFGQPYRDAELADMSFPAGTWNVFPVMHGWDHGDLIGLGASFALRRREIMPLYADLARILTSIEPAADAAPAQIAAPKHDSHHAPATKAKPAGVHAAVSVVKKKSKTKR